MNAPTNDAHLLRSVFAAERTRNLARAALFAGLGLGGAGLLIGLGVAAVLYAKAQQADPGQQARILAEAFKAMPPLRLEPVRLTDGSSVAVRAEAPLPVAGTVTATGEVIVKGQLTAPAPSPVVLPDLSRQPVEPAIQREVTVFNRVEVAGIDVMTGWNFPSGRATAPTAQFCYVTLANGDGTSTRINLMTNGQLEAVTTTRLTAFQLDQARTGCRWFQS